MRVFIGYSYSGVPIDVPADAQIGIVALSLSSLAANDFHVSDQELAERTKAL